MVMVKRFRSQNYDGGSRPSRAEELDQRFGAMVLRMRRGVEAFQTNDRRKADEIRATLDGEIKALDDRVQRELVNYVRTLVLDEIVPVATLYYAGPIGRSYMKLAKLALNAKQLGFKVDPYRFRDSIVAIPEEAGKLIAELSGKGLFNQARRVRAIAAEIRQAAPKAWFEPRPKTGELEARGLGHVKVPPEPGPELEPEPGPGPELDPGPELEPEPLNPVIKPEDAARIAAAQAVIVAASKRGGIRRRRSRRTRNR